MHAAELLPRLPCPTTIASCCYVGGEADATPSRLVRRAKSVLRAADGWLNTAIATELGTREKTVGLWRRRFAEQVTAGIEQDAPGRGRPATVQRSAVETEVIRKTTR